MDQVKAMQNDGRIAGVRDFRLSSRRDAGLGKAGAEYVGRTPPHNEEAEQGVLAGVLSRDCRDESVLDALFTKVVSADFYNPAHSAIWDACLYLWQAHQPVDVVNVAEKLRQDKKLESAGGMAALGEISMQAVLGANAAFYAGMVHRQAMQRRLIETAAQIMAKTYATPHDQVDILLDESEASVFSIVEKSEDRDMAMRRLADLRSPYFDRLEELAGQEDSLTGVTSGFPALDALTGGFQKSDLIVVAARPSMGKTAFSMDMAVNAACSGKRVAFFSLEMRNEELLARALAARSGIGLSSLHRPRFLRDDDWRRLYESADRTVYNLYVEDTPAISPMELRARARRLQARGGLDMIVIDYLQLMRSGTKAFGREQEISEISRSLKKIAKEMEIPVIALAQLNRKLEERADKRPILSDLRESGAIEQDADVILFLYRPDIYAGSGSRLAASPTEVIIGKQRNGATGSVNLLYRCPVTEFENINPSWMPHGERDASPEVSF